jgi:thioredoxin-related protein
MKNLTNHVMKRIFLFLFFSFTISTKSIAQSEAGTQFINARNWQEVLSMAKSLNKNILVDAFATWCGPCKEMDKAVYPLTEVGDAVNKQFIAIKLQMDQTPKDNELIRGWYTDVDELKEKYHIEGFPCYLFFTPDGELIYKDLGYKMAPAFIQLVKFAGDPARKVFRQQLADWKNGNKDYANMPALARTVRDLLSDKALALSIAKDYKNKILDQLPPDQQITKENLDFIINNGGAVLIFSTDLFFKTMYNRPQLIDSLAGRVGYSNRLLKEVISREEITNKLFKNDQEITEKPNWQRIEATINHKYPKISIKDFILNEKIGYYKKIGNWDAYTHYKSEQLVANPPVVEGMNVFFTLNVPAWDVFLYCNDKKALERALKWSELSIQLEKEPVQFLDTKANLLYKLGRITEAIQTEEQAIALEDSISVRNKRPKGTGFVPEYQQIIEKMKSGQATWHVPAGMDVKL